MHSLLDKIKPFPHWKRFYFMSKFIGSKLQEAIKFFNRSNSFLLSVKNKLLINDENDFAKRMKPLG